jgi:hypothetical protein
VCHESQQVASKHHSRIFRTRYSPPEVYFDFKKDTLFLDWNYTSRGGLYGPERFSRVELAQVRYLAIEAGEFRGYHPSLLNLLGGGNPTPLGGNGVLLSQFGCRDTEDFLAMILRYFPNLKKLTISATHNSYDLVDCGDLVFMPLFPKEVKLYDSLGDEYDNETQENGPLCVCWHFFETEGAMFDLEKLQRYRKRRTANEENGGEQLLSPGIARPVAKEDGGRQVDLSPLPEIDCQIITTPAIRQRWEKLHLLKATKKVDRERKRKRREKKKALRKTTQHIAKGRYNLRSGNVAGTRRIRTRSSR